MSNSRLPLLSILVPVYNIERYIGACLESIIKQTYDNIEIIVVDDGSTDCSGKICDLYATKDKRINVVHQKNRGLVSARKTAIQLAQGEYIGYVDGDDWIEPNYYSDLLSHNENNEYDAFIAGYSRDLFDSSTPMTNVMPAGIYEGDNLKNFFSNMISTGDFFRHGITTYLWNKVFKRDIIKKNQLVIDERITIGEDGAVVYPALLECKKVFVTKSTLYHYRQREDSMLKKTAPFEQEIPQLQLLYSHLNKSILRHPKQFNLQLQVQKYLLSTCIICSGGMTNTANETGYLPFKKEINGKKIALCGAGTFGQQLEKKLREKEYCEIVAWVDYDYWEYRRSLLDVDPLEKLSDVCFDFVLLGTIDSYATRKMRDKLINMGIDSSTILSIHTEDDNVEKALSLYLNQNSTCQLNVAVEV